MSEQDDFEAQAARAASTILAEHGYPSPMAKPELIHSLISLGYMQGARDELAMLPGRVDEILTTILASVGAERN